ncbi:MAG: response regulator transcription factor [Chloroflexi bacterium]|nr:response regulator transcription factor [Chloroflexota bacterium]
MIRVLMVDDRRLVRQGLQALMRRTADLECIGEAVDGREAVELANRLKPDVILMDYDMPKMDGLQATAQICARQPEARVLIVASAYDRDLVRQALQNGAKGYVAKPDMYTELGPAIRAVYAGEPYYSAMIKSLLDESTP